MKIVGIAVLWLIGVVISVGSTAFWVWMLIDCLTKESDQGNDKLVWALVIVLTGCLGALLYFFVRRPERIRTLGA